MRILRINRVVADLGRAEAFYTEALGCLVVRRNAGDVVLRLGAQTIALVQFAAPAAPYPPDSASNDLWFQHIAVVVSDMDAAYAHLQRCPGWTPISEGGPQTLPPENGTVRAFKFRDPDGHPGELIWFPPGQGRACWQGAGTLFAGIDHSAIAVSDSERSVGFYRSLGLAVSYTSLNEGAPQSRLDGLTGARVHITGLRPPGDDGMGLELLAYEPPGRPNLTGAHDIAADWVTLTGEPRELRDPDGHRLNMTTEASRDG